MSIGTWQRLRSCWSNSIRCFNSSLLGQLFPLHSIYRNRNGAFESSFCCSHILKKNRNVPPFLSPSSHLTLLTVDICRVIYIYIFQWIRFCRCCCCFSLVGVFQKEIGEEHNRILWSLIRHFRQSFNERLAECWRKIKKKKVCVEA